MARTKEAQISFFEVCDEHGNQLDSAADWPGFLSEIASEPIDMRKFPIHDVMTWGEVYTYQNAYHLVLARHRDSVSTLDTGTGEIVDHDADANKPWVEISVIHFLPDTNKIAFVLCSASSPHISSAQEWLNAKRLFDKKLTIQPVFDRNTVAKLRGAAAASLVQVSFSPGQALDLDESEGLFDFGRRLQQKYGDVTVSLELKIEGRKKQRTKASDNILSEVKNLAGGLEFQKAVAKVLQVDETTGREKTELLNFVNHRLTKKAKIKLANRDGRTVRIVSVLEAIYKAADQLKSDLYPDV